ncbi:right-handed parallel beta-helix repeat-containing protein [Ferruginibacter sp.]
MKKFFTLSVLLAFIFSPAAHAKIWRVNNNFGVAADFSSTTACFSSASVHAGDTVHIEASATAYQDFNVTKRLTIIGTGYFLTENSPLIANPKTQANTNVSYVSNIGFAAGSKGSSVSGMSGYGIYLDDSLITVQRCRVNNILVNISSNIYADTIRQNTIGGLSSNGDNSTKAENLIIYNNVFSNFYAVNFFSNPILVNTGYFINNLFYGGTYFNCTNFTFQNNIMSGPYFGALLSSNSFFNCIADNAGIPSGSGNQLNVGFDNVFVGWSSASGYSSDSRFALKAGSPAIAAGVLNGSPVDCGPFGGPAPYVLSGMPSVPSIYTFTAPTTISSGTTSMNITISTISH